MLKPRLYGIICQARACADAEYNLGLCTSNSASRYMLLLSTLPVRHWTDWRAYTEGKACTRCLPKAIEWVNGILEIYHESIINCVAIGCSTKLKC